MIIFDLDGTLANCEHRRHFIECPWDNCHNCYFMLKNSDKHLEKDECDICKINPVTWKLDWKSFYEACDKDEPIEPVGKIFDDLAVDNEVEIWAGRCESVREKTTQWLWNNIPYSGQKLKMRPIGDYTPDDQLKERWLDEYLNSTSPRQWQEDYKNKHPIEIVFCSDPKSIEMWRRRGIFVFNCWQHEEDFS